MDEMINAKDFALSVVSSKVFDGSPEEIAQQSLELYKVAFQIAVDHNMPLAEEHKRQNQQKTKAFLDDLSTF